MPMKNSKVVSTSIAGAGFLLAILVILAYWPGLGGGFVLDDTPNLLLNADWMVTANEWAQWRRAWSSGVSGGLDRNLAMLTFGFNHFLTGLDPGPMKAWNLALHLVNGFVVWALCRSLFALAGSSGHRLGNLAAYVVASAWLLHPMQVSTVLYVVQRMEIGAQGLSLLALLLYCRGRSSQMDGQSATAWFAGALLAMGAGLGFKESALLVPAYCLLAEGVFFHFKVRGERYSRFWITVYAVLGLAAAVVYLGWVIPGSLSPDAYAMRDFTLGERLLTQPRVLAMYLGQIVWPQPNSFLFYYDQIQASTGLLSPASTLASLLLLAGLVVLGLACQKRRPLVTFGVGLFFIGHFLTSNVIALEQAFEHRNYLALLGIVIALAGLLAGRWPLTWETWTRNGVLALTLLVLAGLTFMQASTWSNPLRLSTTLAARNPESIRANYALGSDWMAIAGGDTSHPLWSLALKQFEHVSALPGNSVLGEQGQIILLSQAGQPVDNEVWEALRAKIARRAVTSQEELVLYAILDCRIQGQCTLDDAQLDQTYREAVRRNPDAASLLAQYANFSYNVNGDAEQAVSLMSDAVNRSPENPVLWAGLVKLLMAAGRTDDPRIGEGIRRLEAANDSGMYSAELEQIRAIEAGRPGGQP